MSQITQTENICADCFHPKANHPGDGHFCTRELTCMCQKYVEPFLYVFAQRIEKEKAERRTLEKRCEYLLEQIPQLRNAGERSFYRVFIEVWHGFKIRKGNPQTMDRTTWDRLPNQDSVNRAKRKCKQFHEQLRTYDPKVIEQQTIIFQAVSEWAVEA